MAIILLALVGIVQQPSHSQQEIKIVEVPWYAKNYKKVFYYEYDGKKFAITKTRIVGGYPNEFQIVELGELGDPHCRFIGSIHSRRGLPVTISYGLGCVLNTYNRSHHYRSRDGKFYGQSISAGSALERLVDYELTNRHRCGDNSWDDQPETRLFR